ncbi:MAG: redoxin family protein [Candidatus Micrarchaeota archaeon]|nr:redoxin family protein [Candidatus Micrarchaeota archaeon]
MPVKIGEKAPDLKVKWVQGEETNISKLKGNVVYIEVFQVNCPGCFYYGIPQAIEIHEKFKDRGVKVLGIATAFEDYDLNTLENLQLLLREGKLIGETKKSFYSDTYDHKIPFPVAIDSVTKFEGDVAAKIMELIAAQVKDFDKFDDARKKSIQEQARKALTEEPIPHTFASYALKGTPSYILIDQDGKLVDTGIGLAHSMEYTIHGLLNRGTL